MLQRFFDGETTCAEEKVLEQYFLNEKDIPEQYLPYRDMFGWFASGMDEEKLPRSLAHKAPTPWRKITWGISIAAAVALMFILPRGREKTVADDISCYEGSFAMRDGVMMPLSKDLSPEIDAVLVEGTCLEQEIDTRMSILSLDDNSL